LSLVKSQIVEMADSVRLLWKATSSRTLWEGLDDISGVVEQGMYQKFIWESCESLMILQEKYLWTSLKARKRKRSLGSQIDHSTDEAEECRLTESVEGRIFGKNQPK
jgi:hypothetical protein